jgi:hypothetical protein
MANISIVPKSGSGVVGTDLPTAEEIKELEELWAYFTEHDGEWAFWEGKTKDERESYKRKANNYLRTRKEGALKLRQIRRQNLPEHQMKFIIEPVNSGE